MKKAFIIGFILLRVVAKGELGSNIEQNQAILNKIKSENIRLKDEIKKLNESLDKLELNLSKEIKFEDLGVNLRRDLNSFTLKITDNDLEKGKYIEILDDFIRAIKYDSKDPIIFEGSKQNIEFLESYFVAKGIDPTRVVMKPEKNENKNLDEEVITTSETKIILKKKED